MSNMNIIEMAEQVGVPGLSHPAWRKSVENFAALVEAAARAEEREAIAQMFEGAPALVQFAQNDKGGCLICGFTPKLAIEAIRARGTT